MKSWFKITNKGDKTASIDIMDEIGYWGVTAKDFVTSLRALPKDLTGLELNIDCPGGDCNDGFTIYDAIKSLNIPVTAHITGIAASMASVIMLAAKTITIAENGRVMIHRVSGGAFGNADEMDAAAKVMKQFEDRIVSLYVDRTSKAETEIRELMKAQMGTWYFGQEAVDAGFADKVITGTKASAFKNQWAHLFTVLPAALFDTQTHEKAPPTPTNPTMTDANKLRFRALLALATRKPEEETELTALQAEATTAKYDPEKDIIQDKLNALEAKVAAKEKADADAAKAKADAEALKAEQEKSGALLARIDRLEKLVTSGILASAGGTDPAKTEGKDTSEKKVVDTSKMSPLQLVALGRVKTAETKA